MCSTEVTTWDKLVEQLHAQQPIDIFICATCRPFAERDGKFDPSLMNEYFSQHYEHRIEMLDGGAAVPLSANQLAQILGWLSHHHDKGAPLLNYSNRRELVFRFSRPVKTLPKYEVDMAALFGCAS